MKEIEIVKEILKTDHLFLTGSSGAGKSYLTARIIEEYEKDKKQVVSLGSTGISAVNIGGQTIHSFFAFGICKNTEELLRYDKNRNRLKELYGILSNTDLLVIDEISMVSAALMEMIRYRLNASAFNGSILFVGDFFQLPPIQKKDEFNGGSLFGDEIYAFESSAWKNYDPKILELTNSKRTDDRHFFKILNQIRKGEIDDKTVQFFENLRQNRDVMLSNPTMLFGRNYEADRMNKKRLDEIDDKERTLEAEFTLHEKSISQNRIESWHKSLNIPLKLELKIGAHVLFCVNRWGKYYNGERGIIRGIFDEYLLVEKKDELIKVEPYEFSLYENILEGSEIKNKTLATLKQFPLKLSYAITIHKSQGMSIEKLVCDIDNIFENSQFYVAVSRAMSAKNLYIRYSRGDFDSYLRRCVRTDDRVKEFYKNAQTIILKN
ncbi:MAG: AAA family ATPase [Campylobacteraceae bacterium]|jgi:ATP-dependent exoDNAse (exonuclease V) alpha subunit|nr:AAA family ATPase [Campylobacteraceae bacterium]